MAKVPTNTEGNGRTENGQFAPGNKASSGRAKGPDFRALVTAKLAEQGLTLEDALWGVWNDLVAGSKAGDTSATRIILDRMCGAVKQAHEVKLDVPKPVTHSAPPDGDWDGYAERFLQVSRAERDN